MNGKEVKALNKVIIRGVKIVVICIITLFILFPIQTNALENNVYKLTEVEDITHEWEIYIHYPEFQGLTDQKFQEELNMKILTEVNQTISNFKKGAEETPGFPYFLYITPKVVEEKGFYSVLLRTDISSGNNFSSSIVSYNFHDREDATLIPISSVISSKKALNKAIKDKINENPKNYLTGDDAFQSVRDDQPYYVMDDKLIVVFNKYEISYGYVGIPEIPIPLEEVQS